MSSLTTPAAVLANVAAVITGCGAVRALPSEQGTIRRDAPHNEGAAAISHSAAGSSSGPPHASPGVVSGRPCHTYPFQPPPDLPSPGEQCKRLSPSVPMDWSFPRPGPEHLSDARRPAAFLRSITTLRRPAARFHRAVDAGSLLLPDAAGLSSIPSRPARR